MWEPTISGIQDRIKARGISELILSFGLLRLIILAKLCDGWEKVSCSLLCFHFISLQIGFCYQGDSPTPLRRKQECRSSSKGNCFGKGKEVSLLLFFFFKKRSFIKGEPFFPSCFGAQSIPALSTSLSLPVLLAFKIPALFLPPPSSSGKAKVKCYVYLCLFR